MPNTKFVHWQCVTKPCLATLALNISNFFIIFYLNSSVLFCAHQIFSHSAAYSAPTKFCSIIEYLYS